MTRDRGGHPFTVAAWILVVALLFAGTAGVLGGILSRSLVVDLIALWPLLVVAVAAGLITRMLRKDRRAGAVLPLAIFTALVLAAALHLGGWERLPSGAISLRGPAPAEMSDPTELIVQISGDLELEAEDSGVAYQVEPIPRGGRVGVPRATETAVDEAVSVEFEAVPDAPSWYRFSGWSIDLSPDVNWRLVLNGHMQADLTMLTISSAAIAGSGVVRLGAPPETGSSVIIAGDLEVIVPPGAPVLVSGQAQVPPDWEEDGDRHRSPNAGADGNWTISVQGEAIPRIVEG